MSRGILYIATGRKSVEETLRSAATVRRYMPNLAMTLVSDLAPGSDLFEQHIPVDQPTFGPADKVDHIHRSPYDETLYLDSDTLLLADIRPLFELLQQFDFAAALSPYRAQFRVTQVPDAFPEYNSGVLLFRRCEVIAELFQKWSRNYHDQPSQKPEWLLPGGKHIYGGDLPNQPALRRALYQSSVRIAALPPEYNCRINFPGALHTPVKLIHGRPDSAQKTAALLNRKTLPRVHLMQGGKLKVLDSSMPAKQTFSARLRWSFHQQGLWKTLRSSLQRLLFRNG